MEEVNIVESITDLQQHIRKRLTEIEDLDERKDAREILLEGLVPIFERMEKRYPDLENQIKRLLVKAGEKSAGSPGICGEQNHSISLQSRFIRNLGAMTLCRG